MSEVTPSKSRPRFSLNWLTSAKLRIFSGLILMVYVTTHFTTHSFGLISLEALGTAGSAMKTLWRWLPLTILLYGALLAHFGSALWYIYQRNTFKMPAREWFQLILGILIPLLLVTHVIGTRYASAKYGINDTYAYVLISTFVFSPFYAYLNAAGLIASWIHGCIGMHMWARFKPWYSRRIFQWGLVFATMLPALSLTGYLSAGRRIVPLSTDGEWLEIYYQRLNLSSDDVWIWLGQDTEFARNLVIAVLAIFIIAQIVRAFAQRRKNDVSISYFQGPILDKPSGPTLLEFSILNNVPHASVCGGRGR